MIAESYPPRTARRALRLWPVDRSPIAGVYTLMHNPASGPVAQCLEQPMETKSVGIREFRTGLAEFIDNGQPVAVTRHGQTVGFFIPTARPGLADLQALRDAATKLEAVMLLTDEQIEASVRDFDTLRKGAAASRRARK